MRFLPNYIDRKFILLCLASLFFYFSFNMILPELNGYIETLGGHDYKGYILFLFTLFAAFSRPFSGKLVDNYGRVPTMIFGSAVACLASLFYPFASTLFLFFALRCFHGLSTGFTPTGNTAMVSDIIPANKRGEAMGTLGFVGSIGMASGPVVGSFLKNNYGYNIMFYTSAFFAFISMIVVIKIKETLPNEKRKPFGLHLIQVKIKDIFEPRVLKPTAVFFLFCLGYGCIYAVIPDLAKIKFNITNLGNFFAIAISSSFLARFAGGYYSDKKGREPVVFIAILLMAIALLILGLSNTITLFYLGAVLFGISNGINAPSIMAWATDLSLIEKRGRAFSTLFIGMEFGIGFGALLSTKLFNNSLENTILCFVSIACICAIGLILIFFWKVNYFKHRRI